MAEDVVVRFICGYPPYNTQDRITCDPEKANYLVYVKKVAVMDDEMPEAKAMDAPPMDKMMDAAPVAKEPVVVEDGDEEFPVPVIDPDAPAQYTKQQRPNPAWWDVVDAEGNVVNPHAIREADADELIKQLMQGE